jgi:hypothetical protein
MIEFLIGQNADINREKPSSGMLTMLFVAPLVLMMIDRKAYHFAKFRALTHGATERELEVARVFPNADDFRYDFDLSPALIALLRQYDSVDAERPTLAGGSNSESEVDATEGNTTAVADEAPVSNRSSSIEQPAREFQPYTVPDT